MRYISILMFMVLLSGCGTSAWQKATPAEQAIALERFSFAASVAVKSQTKNWQGRIQWEQDREYYAIRIYNSLGLQVARLDGTARQLTVNAIGQAPMSVQNPERWLQENVGWGVPLASLRYWILGLADPNAIVTYGDSPDHIANFKQSAWQLMFDESKVEGPYRVPRKMRMQSIHDPDQTISWHIYRWHLPRSL